MEMTTYGQLKEEIARLQREADKVRKDELKSAIQQIRNLMREFGLSLADIDTTKKRVPAESAGKPKTGKRKGKAAKGTVKVKPKYRSPTDSKLTWSGRGRTPKWAAAWVESGRSLDELLIQ